jgi:hypothetical protein
MEYADQVFLYCKNTLQPGQIVPLGKLTNNPEIFIETVKELITSRLVADIEFTNDYSAIRKIKPMPTANNVYNKYKNIYK